MSMTESKVVSIEAAQKQNKSTREALDKQMVEQLYTRYRGSLYRYIVGIFPGAQHEASEIMQETYLRLLRQDNLQKIEDNARAYLFTVATNLVRDAIRTRINRYQANHVEFDEELHESSPDNPLTDVDWYKSMDKLKAVLVNLPPLTQKIFVLSRFEEMSYPEIASAVGVSTRTVERHMSKACKQMQEQLRGVV